MKKYAFFYIEWTKWNSNIVRTLTRNHHELRQRVLVVKRAAQMKINFCFTTYRKTIHFLPQKHCGLFLRFAGKS